MTCGLSDGRFTLVLFACVYFKHNYKSNWHKQVLEEIEETFGKQTTQLTGAEIGGELEKDLLAVSFLGALDVGHVF